MEWNCKEEFQLDLEALVSALSVMDAEGIVNVSAQQRGVYIRGNYVKYTLK